MLDVKYYDLVANLYIKIVENIGKTFFKGIINSNIDIVVLKTLYNLDKLYNNCIKESCFYGDERKCRLYYSYIYLVDYFSIGICESFPEFQNPLNKQFIDKIEIYPSFSSIGHDKMANDNFECFFTHLIFFFKGKKYQKNYLLHNYYVLNKKEEIVISYVPYPLYDQKEYLFIEDNKITSLKNGHKINSDDLYLKRINYAIKNYDSDILFGPELDGSNYINEKVIEIAKDSKNNIIITPSFHYSKNGFYYNSSMLVINYDLLPNITKIIKNYPAVFKNHHRENIVGNYELNVIHVKGIGKILILICKDFITKDIGEFIEVLNIDLTIVIACTAKVDVFKAKMNSLKNNNQYVIFGNSCSIVKNEENNVFMYTSTNLKECYCKACNSSPKKCNNNEHCIFSIRVSTFIDRFNNEKLLIKPIKKAFKKIKI